MSPLVAFSITRRLRQRWADDLGRIGSRWDGFTNQASYSLICKVRLVDVKARRLVDDYVVEVKGYLKRLTERGAASLAEQMDQTINPVEGTPHPGAHLGTERTNAGAPVQL